jgi:hypothetical protein
MQVADTTGRKRLGYRTSDVLIRTRFWCASLFPCVWQDSLNQTFPVCLSKGLLHQSHEHELNHTHVTKKQQHGTSLRVSRLPNEPFKNAIDVDLTQCRNWYNNPRIVHDVIQVQLCGKPHHCHSTPNVLGDSGCYTASPRIKSCSEM